MATVVTFDVDGTLIHSVGDKANALHKESFSVAFREVFGIDTHIDVLQHHGGTDPLILAKVMIEAHGKSKEEVMDKLDAMKQVMLQHYDANSSRAGDGLELLPGVLELLQRLQQRDDVAVGLVTGNLEPIGWAKMDALGIKHLFSDPLFGGFGTDHCSGDVVEMWRDRAEFIRIANKKVPGTIKASYHVGDTPYDVKAAQAAGVTPVGVVTGVFSADDLQQAVPETVLVESFADVDAAMRVFGLSAD